MDLIVGHFRSLGSFLPEENQPQDNHERGRNSLITEYLKDLDSGTDIASCVRHEHAGYLRGKRCHGMADSRVSLFPP